MKHERLCFAYIACPSEDYARLVAEQLLKKRLIGCANIFPIRSMYWWEGKIVEEFEAVLLGKTRVFEKVKQEVEKIHEYEVPCILKIPFSANAKYSRWLNSELNKV